MFVTKPKPKYEPGTRVRVVQHVRVGHRRWRTEAVGTVVDEGERPVGGIEMGGKALYCRQTTLKLRRDDGELLELALDENTQVEPIEGPGSSPSGASSSSTAGGPNARPEAPAS